MKIELYYNGANDCVQMVQDEVLKFYDEYIDSTEFLNYFDVDSVEDLKKLPIEKVAEAYKCILADFKRHCGTEEVQQYFDLLKQRTVQGKLVFSGEFESR